MSDAQRQQLDDILNDIYAHFCEQIALARGKTEDQVQQLIDRGVTDVRVLEQEGFIDGVRYRDAVRDLLKPRTGGGASEVPQVTYEKYSRASPSSFGLRDAKKTVAIVHLTGQIVQGKAGRTSGSIIAAEDVVETTRNLASDDKVKAVVLRVDSPGGDALASEIAWRELSLLARKKPVIASMVDVAASGGYFISMAASHIIADPLTLTGSIGVVGVSFFFFLIIIIILFWVFCEDGRMYGLHSRAGEIQSGQSVFAIGSEQGVLVPREVCGGGGRQQVLHGGGGGVSGATNFGPISSLQGFGG